MTQLVDFSQFIAMARPNSTRGRPGLSRGRLSSAIVSSRHGERNSRNTNGDRDEFPRRRGTGHGRDDRLPERRVAVEAELVREKRPEEQEAFKSEQVQQRSKRYDLLRPSTLLTL